LDGSYGPAMIARIDNVDGDLIGVHRTWLAHDELGAWGRQCRPCSAASPAALCGSAKPRRPY
jgi:hypothetical protein